jgi:hypothetical protein
MNIKEIVVKEDERETRERCCGSMEREEASTRIRSSTRP